MKSKSKQITLALILAAMAAAADGDVHHQSTTNASHSMHPSTEKYSCEWKKTYGPGEEEGYEIFENADFSIELHNSRLKELSINSGYQQGREGGYGLCQLYYGPSPEDNKNIEIKQKAGDIFITTNLEMNDPEHMERFVIHKNKNGFVFKPLKTALGMCGMGWSWPDSIEIKLGIPVCKVLRQE